METTTSRENIKQLLGAYFHQDWNLDDPTWESVVERYVRDEPGQGRIAATELERLLISTLFDEDVSAMVKKLGCYYWAGSASEMRTWASQVVRLLREIDHQ